MQISEIIRITEQEFSLKKGVIVKRGRTRTVADARATAMYFARMYTSFSLWEIADGFQRDHSTVLHNIHKVKGLMSNDTNTELMSTIISIHNALEGR